MFKFSVDLKEFIDGVAKGIAIANTGNMLANMVSLVNLDIENSKLILNYTDSKKSFILKLDATFTTSCECATKQFMLDLSVLHNTLQLCSGTSSISTGDLSVGIDTEKSVLVLEIEHYLGLKETADDGTDTMNIVKVGRVNQSLNYFTSENIGGNSRLEHRYKQLQGIDFNKILDGDTIDFSIVTLKDIVTRKGSDVRNLYFSDKQGSAFTASLSSLSVVPYKANSEFFYILSSAMAKTLLDTMGSNEDLQVRAEQVDTRLINLYFRDKAGRLGIEYKMDLAIQKDLDTFKEYTNSDYSNSIVVYKDVLCNVLGNLNRLLTVATNVNVATVKLDDGTYSLVLTLKSTTDTKRFDVKILNELTDSWSIDINTNLLYTLVGYCKESKITLGLSGGMNSIKLAIYDSGDIDTVNASLDDIKGIGRYYTQVSGGK